MAEEPLDADKKTGKRPPGEIGGHTVQPGEESSAGAPIAVGATSRETPAPSTPEEGPQAGRGDKPVEAPTKSAGKASREIPADATDVGLADVEPPAAAKEPPAAAAAKVTPPASSEVPSRVPDIVDGEALETPGNPAGPEIDADPPERTQGSREELPSFHMREPVQGDIPARRNTGEVDRQKMVDRITASLAEMLARALRQSVEQAVEESLGKGAVRASEAAAVHKAAVPDALAPQAPAR